jgi:Vitelline membrane outer layer protein I (VOMI)
MLRNFFFPCFFLSLFLLKLSSRTDFIRQISSSSGDTRGSWKNLVYCPEDYYIYAFNQKVDCQSTGVNVLKVVCRSPFLDNTQKIEFISYDDPEGTWQTLKYCLGDYMNSYFVSKDGYSFNELSVSDVRMKCIDETTYNSPGGACNSDLTSPASCLSGEAMCGYQVRFMDPSLLDDLGVTDTLFMCCCLTGYFLYTNPINGGTSV